MKYFNLSQSSPLFCFTSITVSTQQAAREVYMCLAIVIEV